MVLKTSRLLQVTIAVTTIGRVPIAENGKEGVTQQQQQQHDMWYVVHVADAPPPYRRCERRSDGHVGGRASEQRRGGRPSVRLGRATAQPPAVRQRHRAGRVQTGGDGGQRRPGHGRRRRLRRGRLRRQRRSAVRRTPASGRRQQRRGVRPNGWRRRRRRRQRPFGRHALRAAAAVEQRQASAKVPGETHIGRRHHRPAVNRIRETHRGPVVVVVGGHRGGVGRPFAVVVVVPSAGGRPATTAVCTGAVHGDRFATAPGLVVVVHARNDGGHGGRPAFRALRRHRIVRRRADRVHRGPDPAPASRRPQQPESQSERRPEQAAAAAAPAAARHAAR